VVGDSTGLLAREEGAVRDKASDVILLKLKYLNLYYRPKMNKAHGMGAKIMSLYIKKRRSQ